MAQEFVITVPEGIDGERYRQMRMRFQRWGPIREAVQGAFIRHQASYYARRPIGDMQRLGPKILSGDYVHARGKSISVGVKSEYAAAYAKWREEKGQGPLFDVSDKLISEIVDIVEAYVLLGLGATQSRRKRRRRG